MASPSETPVPIDRNPDVLPVFVGSPPPEMSLTFLSHEEVASLQETVRTKMVTTFQDLTRNFHNAVNQKEKDRVAFGEFTKVLTFI